MKENPKSVQEELEALSPLLAQRRKNSPKPQVGGPSGYFEDLQARVLQAVERPAIKPFVRPWWQRLSTWAAAASLALLLGSLWYLQPQNPKNKLASLPQAQIQGYLQQHLEDLEAEDMIANLSDEEFKQLENAFLAQQQYWEGQDADELLQELSEDEILSIQ
jgi:hypothetical protein